MLENCLVYKFMGLIFAFLAMFSWGVGDFLIQRSARRFGSWIAIFLITVSAAFVLFPFIYKELPFLFTNVKSLIILFLASLLITFASITNFEALRIGKISIIEPVYAFEIPITTLLAAVMIKEYLTLTQWLLICGVILGIILVSTESVKGLRRVQLEKGVFLAICATICMGAVNFLFGVGSRETSPLLINWFTSLFLAIVSLGFLIKNKEWTKIGGYWRHKKKLIMGVCFFDNLAWIAYSYSALYIPIAIATGISESYIVLASLLGLVINKEKIKKHQFVGLFAVVFSVIILAFITDK